MFLSVTLPGNLSLHEQYPDWLAKTLGSIGLRFPDAVLPSTA